MIFYNSNGLVIKLFIYSISFSFFYILQIIFKYLLIIKMRVSKVSHLNAHPINTKASYLKAFTSRPFVLVIVACV